MVTAYTAEDLLREVQSTLGEGRMPPDGYLLSEYAALLRSLIFLLPAPDANVTLAPEDGMLATDLCPAQVRRVFTEGRELLRGSLILMRLLPSHPVFCPTEKGIAVSVDTPCTVYYRAAPAVGLTDAFPLDVRYLPMVRTYLLHRACVYVGDSVGADTYCTEYNRMLADFKAENGVRV